MGWIDHTSLAWPPEYEPLKISIHSRYLWNKEQHNLVDVFGDDAYAQLHKEYATVTIQHTYLQAIKNPILKSRIELVEMKLARETIK